MSVSVPRLWPGETVAILGAGPSLMPEDVDYCRGKVRVIAVNFAYLLAPWADVLYSGDSHWWRKLYGHPPFAGPMYGIQLAPKMPAEVQILQRSLKTGLDRDPRCLCIGGPPGMACSGYQAINLAVHLGAARILLLGYDLQAGKNRRKNFDGAPRVSMSSPYPEFRKAFPALVHPLRAAGVTVVNCSRETALGTFPRMPLRDALEAVAA